MSEVQIISSILQVSSLFLLALVLLCMYISKRYKTAMEKSYLSLIYCNSAAILFDFLALICRVNNGLIFDYGAIVTNFLSFASNFLLVYMFFRYFTEYLAKKIPDINRFPLRIIRIMTIALLVLLVVNLQYPIFYSFTPLYTRGTFFWLGNITGFLSLIWAIVLLVIHRKELDDYEIIGMWTYITLPIVALILQMGFYGIAFMSLANTLSIVIIFIFLQSERERRLAEQEKAYIVNQMNISLSQIQPHFLNNALNTIQYLCESDPKLASQIVGKFSKYMRMNLDSVSQNHPIPFTKDLEHLENYLSIEKIRFPEISFVYHIESTDFSVPPLTLQPLVENAIKHGVRQLESGGVVKISTFADTVNHTIIIEDNGGGFDVHQPPSDNKNHIGISNTRTRLEMMCNGTMSIVSNRGKGTIVTIQIPIQTE